MGPTKKTFPTVSIEPERVSFSTRLIEAILDYQTLKIVNIGDKKIGLLHRIIQLIILAYIVGFVIIYKRGYQQFSNFSSATTSKVKGVASTLHLSDQDFDPSVPDTQVYRRVWDVVDLVHPPSEPDAFFITTNLIITPQRTARCPDEDVKGARCHSDNDCSDGRRLLLSHGEQTGFCVTGNELEFSDTENAEGFCEIRGWCPVERDVGPLRNNTPLFRDVQDFTVLLKNYIEFPLFNLKLRNIVDSQNRTYLKSCLYHPEKDPHCPKFRIGDIIAQTGNVFDSIATKGGVVHIVISWNCNLDWDSRGRRCIPRYSFSRIDTAKATIGRGWNFRHAHVHNVGHRTLFKAYGITFRISVMARAGKLSLIPIAINVGSGLGLLAVAKIVCDFVVIYCHRNREIYKQHKFNFVGNSGQKRRATISVSV